MAFLEEYTLLDELGQGGYATVYKVRHNNLGYIRAIRVLNAIIAHGDSDPTYQKFLEECRLLLRLGNGNHPNIVHIYQPLLKAQRAIVEMDFVDGKDLFGYLKEKGSFIEIDDVLQLLKDIGHALAYCHEDIYKFCMDKDEDNLQDDPNDGSKALIDDEIKQRLIDKYRVIHNDIHSGNIIRREDGRYVLLDFGLAIDGNSVIRSSRRKNGGAPEFKAPEKWDNESLLTTQSDIYSFGVVLYEYLTGRVPFVFDKKNSNHVEAEYLLGRAHKEQQPESIFELRKATFENTHNGEVYTKDYPDWLEELIMKCLAKSPEQRFKNGKELHEFILEHINSERSNNAVAAIQIENLENENKSLSKLLSEQQQKSGELQNEIIRLQNEITRLTVVPIPSSSSEGNKLVNTLQIQINELLKSKNDLQTEVDELKSENAKLHNAVNNHGDNPVLVNKIRSLEHMLNIAEKDLNMATSQLRAAQQENWVLRQESEGLKKSGKGKSVSLIVYILTIVATAIVTFIVAFFIFAILEGAIQAQENDANLWNTNEFDTDNGAQQNEAEASVVNYYGIE